MNLIKHYIPMTPTEIYLFLLTDSFIAGLVLPAKYALVFPTMQALGGYNLYLASLIYTIGITAASGVNWYFGKLLRSLKKGNPSDTTSEPIRNILDLLKKHGHWIALLGFVPILGGIVTVFSGLYLANWKKVMAIVFTVNIIYATGRVAAIW